MLRALILAMLLSVGTAAQSQVKNGFDLSDSLVPASDIQSGGPPRDGMPSIDDPKFVTAEQADFLADDDRVPDSTFGVSGLLYNSDVLLYDRRTESLWSQIMAKAVAGPLKNTELELLPSQHTSWDEWRTQHPDTLVLSTDTGFRRDYSRSPYLSYERSNRLMFGVEHRNDAYANKEFVLGIADDGQARAYPFEELEAQGERRFTDTFAGREITVVWSESAQSARVLDASGEEIPSVLAYWFAWYAFHPDTEIFRAVD